MQPVQLRLKLCALPFLLCCIRNNSRKARCSDPRQRLCGSNLDRPRHRRRGGVGCQACVEEANHRHRRLLRARRERPQCRRAAELRDECAAIHSNTSSAPYRFGEKRVATLTLLTFTAPSRPLSCGVDITKFSDHVVAFLSSPTLFADTPMSRSTSTRILSGKPPRAMWSAATLLGLYRMRVLPDGPIPLWYCLKQSTTSFSFDHLVGVGEQLRRHLEAEGLCRLEVDHQLAFGRLLNRQIGRFGPLRNSVDICGGAPAECGK